MAKTGILIIVLLTAVAGGYYYTLYPPALMERAVRHKLHDFNVVVAGKDHEKIKETLKEMLSDSAQIHLEVVFPALGLVGAAAQTEDFDKSNFVSFIDNIVYSLSDYRFDANLAHFHLSPDRTTAAVTFTATAWAEGMSYYGGLGTNLRYNSDTTCEGQVGFEGEKILLDSLNCKMKVTSIPKPTATTKF